MGKKMGRPLLSDSPLNRTIRIRLDDETYEELRAFCAVNGENQATVVRKAIQNFLERMKAK